MSNFLSTFNPDTVDYSVGENELLPVGEYLFIVEKIEERHPEGKTAHISIQLKVAKGDKLNRVIFDNLYLSEKSMPFTSKKLGRFCQSVKIKNPMTAQNKLVKAKIGSTITLDNFSNS
jgi:hypothetical protein